MSSIDERIEKLETKIKELEFDIKEIKESITILFDIIKRGFVERRITMGGEELLPASHKSALALIRSKEDKTITAWELAQKLGLSRSRASEILNELYKLGYLEKKRIKKEVAYILVKEKE